VSDPPDLHHRAPLTSVSDDEEEDETAALMRELEKIKKERAEAKAKEERERAAEEEEQREIDVARGNPLLAARKTGTRRRNSSTTCSGLTSTRSSW
jgi:protein CWC15